jgi:hypothetical protein
MSRPITVEFIIAEENQAQIITGSMLESGDYRYFRCHNLDITALDELYYLLIEQPYSENYLQEFFILSRSRDNKTLVIRTHRSLVLALVNSDEKLPNVAEHWREKRGTSLLVSSGGVA